VTQRKGPETPRRQSVKRGEGEISFAVRSQIVTVEIARLELWELTSGPNAEERPWSVGIRA